MDILDHVRAARLCGDHKPRPAYDWEKDFDWARLVPPLALRYIKSVQVEPSFMTYGNQNYIIWDVSLEYFYGMLYSTIFTKETLWNGDALALLLYYTAHRLCAEGEFYRAIPFALMSQGFLDRVSAVAPEQDLDPRYEPSEVSRGAWWAVEHAMLHELAHYRLAHEAELRVGAFNILCQEQSLQSILYPPQLDVWPLPLYEPNLLELACDYVALTMSFDRHLSKGSSERKIQQWSASIIFQSEIQTLFETVKLRTGTGTVAWADSEAVGRLFRATDALDRFQVRMKLMQLVCSQWRGQWPLDLEKSLGGAHMRCAKLFGPALSATDWFLIASERLAMRHRGLAAYGTALTAARQLCLWLLELAGDNPLASDPAAEELKQEALGFLGNLYRQERFCGMLDAVGWHPQPLELLTK